MRNETCGYVYYPEKIANGANMVLFFKILHKPDSCAQYCLLKHHATIQRTEIAKTYYENNEYIRAMPRTYGIFG